MSARLARVREALLPFYAGTYLNWMFLAERGETLPIGLGDAREARFLTLRSLYFRPFRSLARRRSGESLADREERPRA